MNRSKKILITCHCLLNSNAKICPLATEPGAYTNLLKPYLDQGVGLVQLPCPETCYLGMNRWGMTKEQYDHPSFRKFCSNILEPTLLQAEAFIKADYKIIGVAGMDNSPSCGINITCTGYSGGEICSIESIEEACRKLQMVKGRGVFMEVLQQELEQRNIEVPFFSLTSEKEL